LLAESIVFVKSRISPKRSFLDASSTIASADDG
jgi:hypothetical protein